MGVGVHGLSDGGVPKKRLHQLGMDPTAQQQGSGCVPKVVEADLRKSGVLQQRLEGTVYDV
jgi:hypothetical protein